MSQPLTIDLKGKQFVPIRDTLTERAAGFYRRNPNSITLLDRQPRRVGVINAHGVLWPERDHPLSRWWYRHESAEQAAAFTQSLKRALDQTR